MIGNDYAVGDLVEAVKGERRVIDRIHGGNQSVFTSGPYLGEPVFFALSSVRSYIESGYTLTVIEKAPQNLPTEPGTVITWRDDEAYYAPQFAQLDALLAQRGWRYSSEIDSGWYTPERLLQEIGGNTFTVLEPVPVTAKKVLDAVGEYLDGQLVGRTKNDIIAALAEEFKVNR